MGIGSDAIGLLIWLKQTGHLPHRPAVVELGAQQLSNTFLRAGPATAELARVFGRSRPFELPQPRPSQLGDGQIERLHPEAPFARDFWTWLGFEYASIDIDGRHPTIDCQLRVLGPWDESFSTLEHHSRTTGSSPSVRYAGESHA